MSGFAESFRRGFPAVPRRRVVQIGAGGDLGRVIERADGLVNATPVGMRSFPGLPVPAETLGRELWVVDVIYVPIETELLARARALGCRTLDGGGMAVFQAVSASELFTGRRADAGRMRRHFETLRGDAGARRRERAQARSTSSIL